MKERNVDHEIPDFMKQLNERVRVEARRKLRKLIAIIVVLCLVFGLIGFLCGRASAISVPVEVQTLDYFIDNLIPEFNTGRRSIDAALEGITAESSVALSWYSNEYRTSLCLFVSQAGLLACDGGYWFCSEPEVEVYAGWYLSGEDRNPNTGVSTSSVAFTRDGVDYYPVLGLNGYFITYDVYQLYYSDDFILDDNFYSSPNLVLGSYEPDHRSLDAFKVFLTDNYYLNIEASPSEAQNFVSVHLTYYDTLGTFTKVIDRSDGIRVYDAGEDDIVVVSINPNLVSQYKFTLTGVEFVAAGSYGTKAISDLDLIFNEDPFPVSSGHDTIISYNTYSTFHSTGIIGGGIADFDIGYLDGNQNLLSWRDSTGLCYQPFKLKWIAIPNFLWNYASFDFADFNADDYFQLFETYDVVILGVTSSVFNDLYPDWVDPTNTLNNYEFVHAQALVSVEAAITTIMGLQSPYRSCDKWQADDSFTVTDTDSCGFVWTRNLLLKQISYFCGDTSDRLLEFEKRLVDDDGILSLIQEKMVLNYEQNNDFFNDVLPHIDNIVYALDKLDFGALGDISAKLDRIIDYLDFDIDIDVTKLARPWSDIFLFAKKMFDDSAPMWDSISSSASTLYDGLPVSNQYDVESLPDVSGPIPLFPTIAPVPVIPTLSPTPVPIGSGG